jgi:hypothetical protein
VDKDATMEPPIHTQNFLSGAATIFVIIFFGTKVDISLCRRSGNPAKQQKLVEIQNLQLYRVNNA